MAMAAFSATYLVNFGSGYLVSSTNYVQRMPTRVEKAQDFNFKNAPPIDDVIIGFTSSHSSSTDMKYVIMT